VTLRTWIQTWSPAKKEVGALVTGPPGIGKTTAVHLLLSAAGYEIIELNASDERSATAIRRTLHDGVLKSSNTGLGAKPRALVLDEVDGMSSGDRGGIGELARILRGGPKLPIICIANERTPRLRPLTNVCMDIRFQRPVKTTIVRALMSGVVAKEGLSITAAELETLCERNGNDIRSLLNFLQFGSAAGKDDLQRLDAFSATGRLFGGGGTVDDKMNLVFVDHGLVPLMVAEGYVAAAEKGRGFGAQDVMARISAAADHLEVADLLDRRIHRTQAWGLLPAATVATAAAARAAGGPAPFQIFPAWLGKASKRSKHRRLLNDLLSRAAPLAPHSGEDACETLQHLRERFGGLAATQDAVAVVDALLEAGMTRDDLLETLAEVGFEELKLDTKRKTALTREWNKRCASKGVKGGDDDSVGSDDYVSDVESVEVDYE
jgi:replication factor C subunit 1